MMNFFRISVLVFISHLCTAQQQGSVVIEKFTNAYCGACPNATITLQEIQTLHPDVIWLSHHKPVSWTNNALTNPESEVLWDQLDVPGTPMGMVDRYHNGSTLLYSRSQWQAYVEQQLQTPDLVRLEIVDFTFDQDTREVQFRFDMTALSDLPENNYHLTAVMVEDSVWGVEQHNYFNDEPGHPLEGWGDIIWAYPHRNVVRHLFGAPWGIEVDGLEQASSGSLVESNTYTYTLPEKFRLSQLKLVGFVSTFDEQDDAQLSILGAVSLDFEQLGIVLSADDIFTPQFAFTVAPNPTDNDVEIQYKVKPDHCFLTTSQGELIGEFILEETSAYINAILPQGNYHCHCVTQSSGSTQQVIVLGR